MKFKRSSGVLLHLSSLPGSYGIGGFGQEAKNFIDFLSSTKCTYWQILPFGPADAFNSPYKSISAFAGNPYFIDLEALAGQGLLTPEELGACKIDAPYAAAFDFVRAARGDTLRLAYSRISPSLKAKIIDFAQSQPWLSDYALYQALCLAFGSEDWSSWEDEALRDHRDDAVSAAMDTYAEEIGFQKFLQYEFFTQWAELRSHAKEKGIKLIGDMPIYVSFESVDVWANADLFDLDEKGRPRHIAGVPPDYFSEDGQLWGNPIYDWQAMKAEGYKWWLDRIDHSLSLFDTIRIDHFRAFSAYWSVDGDAETARYGQWIPGPGTDFFDVVFDTFSFDEPRIIAEDLGVVDEGVTGLLEATGFPGMRVLQFGFIEDGDNLHLPHNYEKNSFAYTGTHDNNTLLGFMWELSPEKRRYAFEYIGYNAEGDSFKEGGPQSPSCRAFVRALFQSCANVAIVPIQDLCGFGSDTKMNCPGCAAGNWAFRLPADAIDAIDRDWLRHLNELYKRV